MRRAIVAAVIALALCLAGCEYMIVGSVEIDDCTVACEPRDGLAWIQSTRGERTKCGCMDDTDITLPE